MTKAVSVRLWLCPGGEHTALGGWGWPGSRSWEASFPEKVSEPGPEEGGVGRREGHVKYTHVRWVSHQGLCSASSLVEAETCNQGPGSPLSCRITKLSAERRMKEYGTQECVHCSFWLQVAACAWLPGCEPSPL